MENQDRTGGNAAIVNPLRELEVMELVAAGFLRCEAQDLLTLYRDIPRNLPPIEAFEMRGKALRDFKAGLTAPTWEMKNILAEATDQLDDWLEDQFREEDESHVDYREIERDLWRSMPCHRKVRHILNKLRPSELTRIYAAGIDL